jgi:putative ABC transport system permease protein
MERVFADLRHTFRGLVHNPSFTIVAIVVLALGIGANTAVFTLLDALLLRPLPYPNADRLVFVQRRFPQGFGNSVSIPKFNVWRQGNKVLDYMTAFDQGGPGINLRGNGLPELVKAIHVSSDYFLLFGASTAVGRTFSPDEDKPGAAKVAVLSYGLWNRRFGGEANIVGRSVTLGDDAYTVVGVLSANFTPIPETDIWLPLQPPPNSTNQGNYLAVAARLKPGVTLETANAQLKLAGEEFRRQFPEWMGKEESIAALPMQAELARQFRPTVLVLMGAVVLVLLIACANVANLLLARAVSQQKAITIRLALGATRAQLIRQLLTESLLLALTGAALGLLFAYCGVGALTKLATANLPGLQTNVTGMSPVDWRVLGFTVAASLVTGILCGIFPALQFSTPSPGLVLQQAGARSGTGVSQHRTRSVLVISEIALALVLLIGATLLIRTIMALQSVNPGFDPKDVMLMQTSLNSSRYMSNQTFANLERLAVQRIESIPGVLRASPAVAAPLVGDEIDLPFSIEGRLTGGDRYNGDEQWRFIGTHYFSTLNIPIRKGRAFDERDTYASSKVVIINEAMARKYWANDDPIGKRIIIGKGLGPQFEEPAREIIGVVGNVRELGLNQPAPPVMYVPMSQLSDALVTFGTSVIPMSWLVHTSLPLSKLTGEIQKQFLSIDDRLAVANARPLTEANATTLAREKISMNMLAVFSAIAVVLAAVGIFGLLSHSVQQRTQEFGVRLSLGATPGDIMKLILLEAAKLIAAGLVMGIGGAIGLTRLLSSLLFGVRPTDLATFVGVSLFLAGIACLATCIAARRAAAVQPAVALRIE